MAAYHLLDSIAVDDGSSYQNPSDLRHPDGSAFGLDNYFRGGDTVAGLTGVMDYDFGAYKIQPVGTATYEEVNPRTDAPELVEGEIRVASLNVLNYFVTLDDGSDICGPSGDMNCRGADADQLEELARQQAKIINAILGMDADIVGLIEIENEHPGQLADEPVISLVDLLNAEAGAGTYDYIATGPIGTDAIKQAILYKTEKVEVVGDFAVLDSSVDPRFDTDLNRPSLAQTFKDKITEEIFTVSVNHLKSKNSDCDDVGDPDIGDGSGNCNLTRKAAAEALVEWLETDPTATGSDMYVIIGDLNSYAMEDPIDMIKLGADDLPNTADDYYNLVERFQEPDAYGYVYDGQTGYLDHALGNRRFASYVLDANFWHINADETNVFDYDTSFKPDDVDDMFDPLTPYRSSDHDPVLISVLLNHPPVATDDDYTVERMDVLEVAAPGVLENDDDMNIYDNITASLVIGSGPEYGRLEFNSDGSFTYTPDRIYTGEVTFEYIMRATPGLMHDYAAIALVTITVTATGDLIYLPIILK
jgi:predicted extracellular nuclease